MRTKLLTIIIILVSVITTSCINMPQEAEVSSEPIDAIVYEYNDCHSTTVSEVSHNPELEGIILFLEEDKTDEHEYSELYNCGFFARDLARNATENNITIGGAIVTENTFALIKGANNHAINYFELDGTVYFIEPQSDEIMTAYDLYDLGFNHAKLYPDGTMVPTNFGHDMAATYDISEHLGETLD